MWIVLRDDILLDIPKTLRDGVVLICKLQSKFHHFSRETVKKKKKKKTPGKPAACKNNNHHLNQSDLRIK